MDLRRGILSIASELGVSPLDMATIMSYETGGTFDPLKRGPRTQHGQHIGLLQWGEPQAQKYLGGDFSIPSQLKGTVAYMRDAGVKPGMGILDMYSAVNAGKVGMYNASDAHNGGAPGTVRDKVQGQMAGHRHNAERLLRSGPPQSLSGIGSPDMYPEQSASGISEKPKGILGLLPPQVAQAIEGPDGKKTPLGGLLSGVAEGLQNIPNAPAGHLGGFRDASGSADAILKALTSMPVSGILSRRRGVQPSVRDFWS